MKEAIYGIQYTKIQKEVLEDLSRASRNNKPYSYICLFGGGGSGKTFILLDRVLLKAIACPGIVQYIIRNSFNDIKKNILTRDLPLLMQTPRYKDI